MKELKKIEMICGRSAALGCTEDVQIEIERNYNFFREYLEMFLQQSMVEALRSASLLGKIFVTGMEDNAAPTYQTYVLGVLKTSGRVAEPEARRLQIRSSSKTCLRL